MKLYAVKRFFQLLPILIGITLLSFSMMQLAGGDAVSAMIESQGIVVTPEVIAAHRHELGLDRPFIEQYVNWLQSLFHADMGVSFITGKDIFATFISKLPATILLTCASVVATIGISLPLGILSAVRHNTVIDYGIRFLSFFGNSLPNFFVALVLIYIFATQLQILPVLSSGTGASGINSISLKGAILPTATLCIAMSSKYVRQIRAVVLDELQKPYVAGARSRGIKERSILTVNVLRNCMITIVTLLALSIGDLLGGTVIVERIFQWDGVGKLAVDAIMMRDYPMIQAYVVWMALIYVVVNLIADLIYHYLDPRVRVGGES